jgi:hypothetical protein
MPTPFGTAFESLESPAGPIVEAVHEAPYRRLSELIDSGEGQLISLRAPRAGYGKTMLLSRLREKKKGVMMFVPIHLSDGRRLEGEGILEELLIQLTETVSGAAGLTRLDLHVRRLFAHGLLPLVYSGEVPSRDKDGALSSLRERPTEAFDFHHEGAAIAQWTKNQFEILSPRLSSVLSKSSGASSRDTSYWIELFFNYAIRTPNELNRTSELMETVFGRESRFRSGTGYLDRLGSFLNLITLVEPVVLLLDEVDGLSSDSDAALRATSCLVSLWESAPRTSVVLSVNDDVWQSAFAPRLPLGLQDRLEDVVIRLDELTQEEARLLVTVRAGDEAEKVLTQIDFNSGGLYPRGVLKAAREAWERWEKVGKETDHTTPEVVQASQVEMGSPGKANNQEVVADPSIKLDSFGFTEPLRPAYPPQVVRRAALPRKFNVQRIRQSPSAIVDFASPAAIVPPAVVEFNPDPAPTPEAPTLPELANPFQVAIPLPMQSQPVLPPARPFESSPFEPSGPLMAPEISSSPMESPIPPQTESEDQRSLHSSPSNSPFGLAPAQPSVQEDPSQTQSFPPVQTFAAPPDFPAAPPEQVTPPPMGNQPAPMGSPFEAASSAAAIPPELEVPKDDTDAIDELLRQFREHRDS